MITIKARGLGKAGIRKGDLERLLEKLESSIS
jgi:hypothetical protein